MQISFEQEDVERAIALYLRSMGITANVANVSFVAGRKDSGLRTTIDLEDVEHDPIPTQPLKREVLGGIRGRSDEASGSGGVSDPVTDETSDAGNPGEPESNPLPPEENHDEEAPDSDGDAEANEGDGTGTETSKKSIFD